MVQMVKTIEWCILFCSTNDSHLLTWLSVCANRINYWFNTIQWLLRVVKIKVCLGGVGGTTQSNSAPDRIIWKTLILVFPHKESTELKGTHLFLYWQEVILKRAADLVEALYGMPHNNQVNAFSFSSSKTWLFLRCIDQRLKVYDTTMWDENKHIGQCHIWSGA